MYSNSRIESYRLYDPEFDTVFFHCDIPVFGDFLVRILTDSKILCRFSMHTGYVNPVVELEKSDLDEAVKSKTLVFFFFVV